MIEQRQLLTHSRMASFRACRRQHMYSYELGLRRIDAARALRQGIAFHDGIAELGRGHGIELACAAVRKHYAEMPEQFDEYQWRIEEETMVRLVCAYDWRWSSSPLENVKTEFPFFLPLVNPETGRPTPSFDLAGKTDGIVKLEDGRLAVKETKTVGEDLGDDSPLWPTLRIDSQISLYIHAARKMGFAVDTVLYDVCRKPSIEATPVALRDEDEIKIVLDGHGERVRNKNGKTWRQTASTEDGYVLQTRPMTVSEWGERLTADIVSRPSFYFARREIPRLDQDVKEFQYEVWDTQLEIREAQRTGRHYRTVGRNCKFCPYFDICSTSQKIDPNRLPLGFEIVSDVHPELERSVESASPVL